MKHWLVAMTLMSCLATVPAFADPAGDVKAVVDQAAQKFLAANPQSVGFSIGIVKDGQTYAYNYGVTTPGGTMAPTADTLYPIASVTKTFTGILLAQASLDGKLKLDDDVRTYLDGDYPNLAVEGHGIRLFDLVDHRSGLPFILPDRPETRPDFVTDIPWSSRLADIYKTYHRKDFYNDLHKVTLKFEPGSAFQYSNAAATLAGYIVERVYAKPYEQVLKDKVLLPLGMTATTITVSPAQSALLVHGYDGKGDLMPYVPDEFQGAGALKSSVNDMLKYVSWQIAETDPAVQLAHKPYFTSGSYAAGLNWQMLSAPGKRIIWQSGDFEGFHSYCVEEPERHLGLVLLANQADPKSSQGHGAMVNEILHGLDPEAMLLP